MRLHAFRGEGVADADSTLHDLCRSNRLTGRPVAGDAAAAEPNTFTGLLLSRRDTPGSGGNITSYINPEIDALIDEYGSDALAVRFMQPWVSEPLGRLVAAGLDELGTPSLGGLLAIAERGLLPRLIAQGEIDDDEAQTVIAELQSLIERHGEDALAEDFQGNN